MGGLLNSEEGKFNFKIKIVQTDLASQEYLSGMGFGDGFDSDPAVYQNSSYISKLYFINNYSGGILAKDKIEDMPERYRRFIKTDAPTEAEIIRDFQNEMIMLANREEIGQNVFFSSLSGSAGYASSGSSVQVKPENQSAAEYAGSLEDFDIFNIFEDLEKKYNLTGSEDIEEQSGYYSESEEESESENVDEDYKDDEEIRDILFLNNVFTSEMYKMSKVEYDFSVTGDININGDGSLNIIYNESEMTGFKDSYIQFLFREDNRDIMTIRRKYLYDTWFTLEKGKRVSIERRDRYSSAVFTTNTQELVNNMTLDGGNMRIAYTTETDGIPTESVTYFIHAERAV